MRDDFKALVRSVIKRALSLPGGTPSPPLLRRMTEDALRGMR